MQHKSEPSLFISVSLLQAIYLAFMGFQWKKDKEKGLCALSPVLFLWVVLESNQ